MTEKVITLFDRKNYKIVGIIIVSVIELDYIDSKIVLYLKSGIKSVVLPIFETFVQKSINIPFLVKRLSEWLKTSEKTDNILIVEPYTLESDNKNKSSRNKRMIEQLNLPYNLERSCVYYGKKSS